MQHCVNKKQNIAKKKLVQIFKKSNKNIKILGKKYQNIKIS